MSQYARRGVVADRLRSALWVLPSVSILVFLAAGALLPRVVVGEDSPLHRLVYQGTAEDARQLLIVISATMLTVTGLVFALSIVALQIASGQFSPRLLHSFMRDLGTQLVLSVFAGTFAFSTAGLFTLGVQRGGEGLLVAGLAVSGALALGLASAFALVYFIHHLARSIQVDVIMRQVEDETMAVIERLYPDGAVRSEPEERCPDPPASAVAVPSPASGYIQAIWPEALVAAASHYDLTITMTRMVGEHVVEGTTMAWAWRRSEDEPPPKAELLAADVVQSVEIGFERTMLQDVPFGIRRLVDIASKALSPAVNDPYTAIQATHHLSVILCNLARRKLGDRVYRDERGNARFAVPLPGLDSYLRHATAQIRRYGAGEPTVARALIELLDAVGGCTIDPDRRAAVAGHLWLVLQDAERETRQPDDAEQVRADGAAALGALGVEPARVPDARQKLD